ncbi:patatin-like phospholipase family protein [Methylohalobius crimeensis]|uniref:patatin-like phospholipase family protein n=1 Tax=Methylohalobius crimeensis TaxID=244365 RepID=UPI001267C7B9|nr:patatin-like phospholipase family protein [Methylohalobius crimeensis]
MSTPVDSDLLASLRRSPLLAGLATEILHQLGSRAHRRLLQAGEVLFRIGEHGEEFYLIVNGKIRLLGPREQGEPVVNELGAGDWFGEMALLTGEPRSATAAAATEVNLLTIARSDFYRLLQQAPTVALGISYYLSHRLRMQTLFQPRRAHPGVIAAVSGHPNLQEARLVLNLAAALASVGAIRVAIVDGAALPTLPSVLPAGGCEGISILADDDFADLDALRASYSLVILRLSAIDPRAGDWLRKAETVWSLDREGEKWLEKMKAKKCWTAISCDPSMGGASPGRRSHLADRMTDTVVLESALLDSVPILQLAPRSPAARTLRRFARQILGCRLGLALSAGGAKALAHLGALRCFERAGLEFDLIAGTSMGAIVGGLYAQGHGNDKLLTDFRHLARHSRRLLLDYGIPATALLRGTKKRALIRQYIGDANIEHLPIPFWAVTADLMSGREVAFGSGRLWQILDATSAVPAVFPPVRVDDHLLVDGWIVNPLPTDILRREGADIVVAVATSAKVEAMPDFSPVDRMGGWAGQFEHLRRHLTPSIIRIVLRSLDVGARERTLTNLALADASVQPPVGSFSAADFGRMDELVERGERAAEEVLPAIQQILRERGQP